MPGIPSISYQQLSADQVKQYKQSQHAEKAASDLATALGLSEYQHDAASAVCVDFVSYTLNFAKDSSFSDSQIVSLLGIAQELLQQSRDTQMLTHLEETVRKQLQATTSSEAPAFNSKQLKQITQFFSEGLIAHCKLYNFLFNQPQEHKEQKVHLQVETAAVEPLMNAMTEQQWQDYNASLAAQAESEEQAQKAAEQQRQEAEIKAAQQLAAQQAEADRQSKLTKPVQTLDEAVEQAVAVRVEAERKDLEAEYHQREASLMEKISHLEASLAAPPPPTKKK